MENIHPDRLPLGDGQNDVENGQLPPVPVSSEIVQKRIRPDSLDFWNEPESPPVTITGANRVPIPGLSLLAAGSGNADTKTWLPKNEPLFAEPAAPTDDVPIEPGAVSNSTPQQLSPVGLLNNACQQHAGLRVVYKQASHHKKKQLYTASVKVVGTPFHAREDGLVLENPNVSDLVCEPTWFSSITQAKNFAATAMLPYIENMKKAGNTANLKFPVAGEGQRASNPSPDVQLQAGLDNVNWVGKLYERFQPATSDLVFTYEMSDDTDGGGAATYKGKLSIPHDSKHSGSVKFETAEWYRSKQLAKAAVARLAIEWLDLNAPQSERQRNERPAKRSRTTNLPVRSFGSTSVPGKSAKDSRFVPNHNQKSTPAVKAQQGQTAVFQVSEMTKKLGLTAPTYILESSTLAKGQLVYNCGATFLMHEIAGPGSAVLEGVVGQVQKVTGKKVAKELCARQVLGALSLVEAARMEGFYNQSATAPLNNNESNPFGVNDANGKVETDDPNEKVIIDLTGGYLPF